MMQSKGFPAEVANHLAMLAVADIPCITRLRLCTISTFLVLSNVCGLKPWRHIPHVPGEVGLKIDICLGQVSAPSTLLAFAVTLLMCELNLRSKVSVRPRY